MIDREKYYLINFKNSNIAMQCESILEGENIKVIPTPTKISEGCGLSIIFPINDLDNILNLLECGNVSYKNLYLIKNTNLKMTIEKIS